MNTSHNTRIRKNLDETEQLTRIKETSSLQTQSDIDFTDLKLTAPALGVSMFLLLLFFYNQF